MDFLIRPVESQADLLNYYRACFPLFKEKFYRDSKDGDDDLFKTHCENLSEVDFFGPDVMLYIAQNNDGQFAGAVWVGVREYNDTWDKTDEIPAWVSDVEVLPEFRGYGLGRRLMIKAEEWAREKSFSRIGLHTDYTLDVARKLYLSLGYKDFAYTLRKRTPKSIMESHKNYVPLLPPSEESIDSYFSWRISRFCQIVGLSNNANQSELESLYPKFKPRPEVLSSDNTTYIIRDNAETLLGLVFGRVHEGAAWILDLEVKPDLDWALGVHPLLSQMEKWAIDEQVPDLAIFLNAKRVELIQSLQERGYEFTNFFMDKHLP